MTNHAKQMQDEYRGSTYRRAARGAAAPVFGRSLFDARWPWISTVRAHRRSAFAFIFVLAQFFAIPVALIADDANGGNQELKALEGKWKAVAMEAGGKPFPKESVPDFTYIVAAGGKATGRSPQGEYQATITVDPTKNPKTIDNLHESGAQQGKKQYGIYELEGDKWTVCMTLPGVAQSDRPKDFSTQDTANVVFIFERLKADRNP